MTNIEAVFLGILQGFTEFLPVSSSGHLILAEHFMGLSEVPLAFDVTLHIGTLVAVLAFFYRDWLGMIMSLFPGSDISDGKRRLLIYLLAGTVPGALVGYLLEDFVSTVLRSPWVVVCTLSGVALLLALAERIAAHRRTISDMKLPDALVVGLCQALAVIPGTSRSGITMTGAMFLGFTREDAAKFSFLLSAPIIAGAGLYEAMKLISAGGAMPGVEYLWGFAASGLSGYAVIAFLMRYLRRHTFYPFVIYRLVLAAIVAVALLSGG